MPAVSQAGMVTGDVEGAPAGRSFFQSLKGVKISTSGRQPSTC